MHRLLFASALFLSGFVLPSVTFPAETSIRKFNVVLDKSLLEKSPKAEQFVAWLGYGMGLATYLKDTGQIETIPEGRYIPTFEAELFARERQVQGWRTITSKKTLDYPYMDLMVEITSAGFLREYVWFYYHRREWGKPDASLRLHDFLPWAKDKLLTHTPQTRAWIAISVEKTD